MATAAVAAAKSSIPADLAKLGFEEDDGEIHYRMLVGSDGLEKTGKSNFWMTAPGPIAGINLDIGLEGVIHKYSKQKKIWVLNYNIPPMKNTAEYLPHLNIIRSAYEAAANHKDVRTLVVDTGTDLWELIRLAEFGTVNPKDPRGSLAYTNCNMLYRGLIKMAYESDKNLVVTHKLDDEWVKVNGKNEKSGSMTRAGFKESSYLIQVNTRHTYDKQAGEFGIEILDCRQNMQMSGYTLTGNDCTFAGLGQVVFPESSPEDWK